MRRSGGSGATESNVASGNYLGEVLFQAYVNTLYRNAGYIRTTVNTVAASGVYSTMSIGVTSGSSTYSEMVIRHTNPGISSHIVLDTSDFKAIKLPDGTGADNPEEGMLFYNAGLGTNGSLMVYSNGSNRAIAL
jgi:hypothetical protein